MTEECRWSKPRLWTDEEQLQVRKASWLELFFDLVFVIIVVILSHRLAHDISWAGFAEFALVFIPVWGIWLGMTYYNDRFESADIGHRIFTFLMMVTVASLAVFINDGVTENSRGFAIAYIAARLLLILMWVRAGPHNERARVLVSRTAKGLSISTTFWIISVFIPVPGRYLLWVAGIVIDIGVQVWSESLGGMTPESSRSYLSERFGLIVIIVLGDSIIDVIRGAADSENIAIAIGVAGVLGLALAFSFWWVYFDNVMTLRTRCGLWWKAAWGYAHLLLLVGLTAMAAGIFNVVTLNQEQIPDAERWLICAAVALSLFAIGLIELTLEREGRDKSARRKSQLLRFGSAVAAALVGLVDVSFSAYIVLVLLLLLVAVQEIPVMYSRHTRQAI